MDRPVRVLVCGRMEMRAQLAELLRPHASVVETSVRDEVLTANRGQTLDAAFIDIDRTDQSGLNIAARLRRGKTLRRMRLIAVSASNQTSELERIRAAGFDLRVAWPIQAEQVLAAFHTISKP